VCHALLHDPAFFRLLTRIDAEFAAQTRKGRCPECAGPLHVADFPRKPRGCPPSVREEYSWRLSFTCGWCDTRSTPAFGAVSQPPGVRGGGAYPVLPAARFRRTRARGSIFGACAHGQAMADLVAQGLPANPILAVSP
jgi:hypothetical protein